ncbi:YunC family protein [Paraglaciecola sp. 2405UD69-4]|uniref:YunC family protein n=1 Tax=Paraglaciecola sp. 2405UD69-4 TaxID=3391836 RepID=UPI0039C9938A
MITTKIKKMSILGATLLVVLSAPLNAAAFDWEGFEKQKIDLKLPLLTVKGEKGLLACAYVDVATCEKTGEACAIVSGVKTHEDMLSRPVVKVSSAAKALGVTEGMTGAKALEILR